jgi:hypothetical protein
MQCGIRYHDAFTERLGASNVDHGTGDGGYRNRETAHQIADGELRLVYPDA